MQGNVVSFQINHMELRPGVYLHEVKTFGLHKVTTYDIRFKVPNSGDYLTPMQAHTIEHVLATYFTESWKDKIYFGPMGCLTGFYLVVNGKHDIKELIHHLDLADSYWEELLAMDYVPAKTPYRCGNYKMLDIKSAYKAWKEFYSNKASWGTLYPILPKGPHGTRAYSKDIDMTYRRYKKKVK